MVPDVFADFEMVAPVGEELRQLEAQLSKPLPSGYHDFLITSNGGEGPIGEAGWLRLYPAGELLEVTDEYGITGAFPGFLLIGTDGGGEALAIDFNVWPAQFVNLPFIGFDDPASHRRLGTDFYEAVTAFSQP